MLILSYVSEENIFLEYQRIINLKENIFYYDVFIEYFSKNFINNDLKNYKNYKTWSVYNKIINNIPTTTNSCETYHRHLNSKFKNKNQNINLVINALKSEERRIRLKIQNIVRSIYDPA
ncbi:hypothetical protein DMUE_3086 [Dictyocoela muelleri]|nr:hypothetical protein DMUE_3086 [Dictyocoela muelleri]